VAVVVEIILLAPDRALTVALEAVVQTHMLVARELQAKETMAATQGVLVVAAVVVKMPLVQQG
jgi:hypothetical protein